MRFRRHMSPLGDWQWIQWKPPVFDRRRVWRGVAYGFAAIAAGYLMAYCVLFPTPILRGRHAVPRVLGLPQAEATRELRAAQLEVRDSNSETHPTAAAGTIIWQDPPAGVDAPSGTTVTLIASSGPSKVSVPDVSGISTDLARQIITAAGLTVSRMDSVQAPNSPPGLVMITRPPAASVLTPGTGVILVVNRGAPTISVPDVMGLSLPDARTKLEQAGLAVGAVTRRRTADANPGIVIGQQPAAQTLAAPGLVVDLIVARSLQ
jgi:eukaryotic-like serine/threonine-protein kinase